jgi:hypothetical protein
MNSNREGGQVLLFARTKGCPKPFNWMEETVTGEENMEALADFPYVESKKKTVLVVSLLNTLHDLNYVGIDTCSAVSVSTERKVYTT